MNIKFNDTFFLTLKDLDKVSQKKKPAQLPTNFIFVIDVSGSMSGELDQIRKQLKNKLPNLVKEGDTVTIIWFSGKNDSGILKEDVEIKSLTNLQDLNTAIDRFLKPIGLTAFHKPLVLAGEAIQRIKKKRSDSIFSLIFLTDGYNNDCSWNDVIKSLKSLESDLAASTFVEYGYYADTKKISEMAELIGGEKVEAERFDEYDVIFEAKVQKTYTSSKKVLIDAPKHRKFEFAFTISDANEIVFYSINNEQVLVPENTERVLFFTNKAQPGVTIKYDDNNDPSVTRLMYSSLYVLSDKLQNDYVDDIFKVLGDKHLYNVFVNAYGKQKLINFKNLVKECIADDKKRFVSGRVQNLVVDENAYCVMNLIDDLTKDDTVLIYPGHDEFNYKRIGAKKVQKNGQLSESQKEKIANASSVEEIKAIADELEGSDLKFEYNDYNKGYNISNLVWSSDRANLSVNMVFDGYINLPKNKFGLTKIDTVIFRNYTLIKDGILNVTKLPLTCSDATLRKLTGIEGLTFLIDKNIWIVDFSNLPIVNKKMVKTISAKLLAEKEYGLITLKALEKVYGYYEKTLFPKESKGFVEKYGKEAEEWLKDLGITEAGGFAPKTTTEKGADFYMAVELKTKISKHSALPTVADVIAKIAKKGVLNPVEELMAVAIKDYEAQISSKLYTSQKDDSVKATILQTWLNNVKLEIRKNRRALLQEIAQIKFSLILSKKWFEEFASFDEDTLNLKLNGKDLTFKFELTEKEINV